jgi:pyruvate dehydrogenase complex dehydrogenase (E1) component
VFAAAVDRNDAAFADFVVLSINLEHVLPAQDDVNLVGMVRVLDSLISQARRKGAPVPYSATTPYVNTISPALGQGMPYLS